MPAIQTWHAALLSSTHPAAAAAAAFYTSHTTALLAGLPCVIKGPVVGTVSSAVPPEGDHSRWPRSLSARLGTESAVEGKGSARRRRRELHVEQTLLREDFQEWWEQPAVLQTGIPHSSRGFFFVFLKKRGGGVGLENNRLRLGLQGWRVTGHRS